MKSKNLNEIDAADYLGLNRQTLANWRSKEKGPSYCKLGRRIIYMIEDLDAYLQARRVDLEKGPDDIGY